MKISKLRWICLVVVVAGCGGGDPAPVGDDDPDPPDAAPSDEGPICELDPCGLPSDEACCMDTVCADWDILGPVECAAECEVDADCDSGCCVELSNGQSACGPAELCEAGGAVPRYLCHEMVQCGVVNDEDDCTLQIRDCVEDLTDSQERDWLEAMGACGAPDENACDSYYVDCWRYQVPWC